MRLAEKTTIDIQRGALERKRATSARVLERAPASREEQEKRRRLELEQRVRQREEDDRQRRVQAKSIAEKRRQEREDADRIDAAVRKKRSQSRKATEQRQQEGRPKPGGQALQPLRAGASSSARTANGSTSGARSSQKSVQPKPKRDAAPAAQLSYEELMRIASGKPVPLQSLPKADPLDQRSLASKHRPSQPPRRNAASSTRPSTPATPASKPSASRTLASASSRVSKSQKPSAAPIRQERPQRKATPEREIDRFGVLPKSASKRDTSVRSAPYPSPGTLSARSSRNTHDSPAASAAHPSDARSRMSATNRNRPTSNSDALRSRKGNTARPSSPRRSRQTLPAFAKPLKRHPEPQHRARSSRPNNSNNKNNDYDDEDEDDDSEYDSMDDFIVDDEGDGAASGGYRVGSIREMFGVRYHDVNDDNDDDMEVSVMQQMREDRRSARIGRLEDEEEERRLEREERERERRRRMRDR
ncbi:hypothetical protein GGI11_002502 [Coemansia sp. RSA 2049]|nr:hypothetical protein GGI11_002502 [Coemansia sp. RSA 2049]KAJ2604118.1 hypothetical protein EV177_006508 [Coemansia sp. RSA 1804]KAJ2688511.1 hypothetical protein GGH99_003018 [Coemansia sp. RSA 1285]